MSKRNTKSALLLSVVSIVICCTMLLGTTMAWFTDSVTSSSNIIKSGTLNVEMSYSTDNATWKDASEGAIFNYTLWEPGYSDLKYVKIENVGNLAFKYQLNIIPSIIPVAGETNLADVIDVYYGIVGDDFKEPAEFSTDMEGLTKVGTLSDLMTDADGAAHGVLLPVDENGTVLEGTLPADANAAEGEVTACIVLHMQESAGNEYQNLSVGDGFSVQLLATQYTYENDSFDNMYDEEAEYLALPIAAVSRASQYVGTALEWNSQSPVNDSATTLETAYLFSTTETYDEAQDSPYAKWHADFVISFNRDVTAADGVGIAGNYGDYDWIGFDLNEELLNAVVGSTTLTAGTPVRLLSTAGISMNYEELCLLVENFYCGAWADGNASDLTMTVELRLYETEEPSAENGNSVNVETGEYESIGNYSYTFGARELPADLPVAVVTDANEHENVEIAWNTQWVAPPVGTQLESVYVFAAQDDYDTAQQSPYADWVADYYVTVSRDIADNELILGGNYGSYGWIGFVAPAVKGNVATPLLQTADMRFTYEDIVLLVQEFTCGVADINDALKGETITVELRLTNPADENDYYTISRVAYTFE